MKRFAPHTDRGIASGTVDFSERLGPRNSTLMFHTAIDFLLALVGVIIFLPVMLLVALAVRLTSPGPCSTARPV